MSDKANEVNLRGTVFGGWHVRNIVMHFAQSNLLFHFATIYKGMHSCTVRYMQLTVLEEHRSGQDGVQTHPSLETQSPSSPLGQQWLL